MEPRQIVAVANRLPARRTETGWESSPGGLVRALVPILRERPGVWVGWAGIADEHIEPFDHDGIRQHPVELSTAELEDFYYGFCNGTIWPLYHDGVVTPEFHRHWWRSYRSVNERYAEAVIETLRPDGIAWVQDYQLQLAPSIIRQARPDATIGFYLHIPFPPIEWFARLPWRSEIVRGLLGSDVVAFQTRRSAENFIRVARRFGGAESAGRFRLRVGDRIIEVQRAPIGIDVDQFRRLARSPEVQQRARTLREEMGNPERVILGVDRMDYTKGIDIRIKAIDTLLTRPNRSNGRFEYVQIAVPSREAVPAYQRLREQIEQQVGRVNGDHGVPGWAPITYRYRTVPLEELVAYYVAADVMLVTPLRDGMNLVAKEYIASRPHGDGVLILSEFAGAAEQLRSALLVNPHDVDALADTIERALAMDTSEARRRMRALVATVRRNDVYEWATDCLGALGA